jgi:hypothetical protein
MKYHLYTERCTSSESERNGIQFWCRVTLKVNLSCSIDAPSMSGKKKGRTRGTTFGIWVSRNGAPSHQLLQILSITVWWPWFQFPSCSLDTYTHAGRDQVNFWSICQPKFPNRYRSVPRGLSNTITHVGTKYQSWNYQEGLHWSNYY